MHRFIQIIAYGMALVGGFALSLLIILTCLSVAGRMLNTFLHGVIQDIAPGVSEWALGLGIGPITGDFEIVEAGIAFAIFAFLPLCQLSSSHAVVDIFTSKLSLKTNRVIRAVVESVFAAVLILIAIQLNGGMNSKIRFGETTFLLQFPVWWGYAASLFAAIIAAIVGLYVATMRWQELTTGKDILEDPSETVH